MTRAQAWWEGIPEAKKALGVGISLGGAAVTLGLSLMGYVGLPTTVQAHDERIRTLEETDQGHTRRIDSADWRLDYTICLLEALSGEGRRTSTQCSADFATGRP